MMVTNLMEPASPHTFQQPGPLSKADHLAQGQGHYIIDNIYFRTEVYIIYDYTPSLTNLMHIALVIITVTCYC